MDTVTCIKSRRSVRKFTSEKVSREIIEELVGTAAYAPSWKNTQTTRYIAIESEEIKSKLATECCAEHNASIINGAPVIIATVGTLNFAISLKAITLRLSGLVKSASPTFAT